MTRQKAFLSGESPRTSMNAPFVILSLPLKMSFCNMSNNHGMLSSLSNPGHQVDIVNISSTIERLHGKRFTMTKHYNFYISYPNVIGMAGFHTVYSPWDMKHAVCYMLLV